MTALRALPVPARAVVAAVVLAGCLSVAGWTVAAAGWGGEELAVFAALALATTLAERHQIALVYRSERLTYSLADALWAGCLLLVDPSVVVLAAGAGAFAGLALASWSPVKVGFNVAQLVLGMTAAAVVITALDPPAPSEPAAWAALALAMAAFQAVNTVLPSVLVALVERMPFWRVALVPTDAVHWLGNLAVGILGALVWTVQPLALPLLAVPLGLSFVAYRGWLRTLQERDRMASMAQSAAEVSSGLALARRLPAPGDADAVGRLAAALNRMLDRLEASFRRERTFIRETSHELRSPITICRGHLEILGPEPTRLELAETVELVIDELDRMARIVEDMSTLAFMEDPASLRPGDVEVARLLADVAAKARPMLDGRLHVGPAGPVPVRADPQRLTQALLNLLRNAGEHTAGATDPIELRAVEEADACRFEVTDRGGGLEADAEARVFEPFFTTKDTPGNGLGLAIVAGIASAHGGSAGVDNRPGDGATFWLRVPR